MKKFFEPVIIIAITTIVISLSFIPVIKNNISAPPGTVYTMAHNYILDYYIYLYHITQGQQGNLISYELHTSDPHIGSLTRLPYTLPGFLLSPLNLPPFMIYHLLRLIYALFFAFSVYYFINFYAKTPVSRVILFFLSYASAGLPLITHLTQIDVIRRSAFIPHFTLVNGLFLLTLTSIFKNKILPSAILIFFLTLFSPFHSFILLSSLVPIFLLKRLKIHKLLILFLFFLPPFLYVNFLYSQGPLLQVKIWEAKQYEDITFFLKDYLLTIGPIIFLAPIGALIAIKKGGLKNLTIIIITAIVYAFLFSPFLNRLFATSNFRFHNFPTPVFLGIFSFYTLIVLRSYLRNLRHLSYLVIGLFVLLSSLSYSAVYRQISSEFNNFPYNVYIPKDLYNGFLWVKNNTEKEDTILTRYLIGNMLPGISGRKVFIGHQISTINFSAKQVLVEKFFTNQMTTTEAQQFLKMNKINYVFNGPEESGFNPYPFLKPVFDKGPKIFKIN